MNILPDFPLRDLGKKSVFFVVTAARVTTM